VLGPRANLQVGLTVDEVLDGGPGPELGADQRRIADEAAIDDADLRTRTLLADGVPGRRVARCDTLCRHPSLEDRGERRARHLSDAGAGCDALELSAREPGLEASVAGGLAGHTASRGRDERPHRG
jgi:hypothetical protein